MTCALRAPQREVGLHLTSAEASRSHRLGAAGIVGFRDASQAPNLTRALLARGYSEEAEIWRGNFMRALRAAERAAVR